MKQILVHPVFILGNDPVCKLVIIPMTSNDVLSKLTNKNWPRGIIFKYGYKDIIALTVLISDQLVSVAAD